MNSSAPALDVTDAAELSAEEASIIVESIGFHAENIEELRDSDHKLLSAAFLDVDEDGVHDEHVGVSIDPQPQFNDHLIFNVLGDISYFDSDAGAEGTWQGTKAYVPFPAYDADKIQDIDATKVALKGTKAYDILVNKFNELYDLAKL